MAVDPGKGTYNPLFRLDIVIMPDQGDCTILFRLERFLEDLTVALHWAHRVHYGYCIFYRLCK